MIKRCSDCKRDHGNQITDYPVGATVITEQKLHALGMPPVESGTKGEVKYHCDDGRAGFLFGEHIHTFHFPEDYLTVVEVSSKDLELAELRQTLMQLALSLGVPVKDLAERGVDRVMGIKAKAEWHPISEMPEMKPMESYGGEVSISTRLLLLWSNRDKAPYLGFCIKPKGEVAAFTLSTTTLDNYWDITHWMEIPLPPALTKTGQAGEAGEEG